MAKKPTKKNKPCEICNPESSSMCNKGVFPNGKTCEYFKPNKMPEPEIKLDPMKAIPRIDLQEKFKEIASLK